MKITFCSKIYSLSHWIFDFILVVCFKVGECCKGINVAITLKITTKKTLNLHFAEKKPIIFLFQSIQYLLTTTVLRNSLDYTPRHKAPTESRNYAFYFYLLTIQLAGEQGFDQPGWGTQDQEDN